MLENISFNNNFILNSGESILIHKTKKNYHNIIRKYYFIHVKNINLPLEIFSGE